MTRREAPISPPVVLTIAGSDSGGGAGIQADLKTIEATGGFGTSAITSVTAQNTRGVEGSHLLPIADIEAQMDAVLSDFDVAAVKTGMLATSEVVNLVADYAPDLPNLVVDPVMVAASGDRLLEPEAEDAYESLASHATLVTPNADEAEVLTGVTVDDEDSAVRAGNVLVEEYGATAALVKGGHVPGEVVGDVLVTADDATTLTHARVDTDATHGSGCTLSSAVATELARGTDLTAAVAAGIDLLGSAVRYNVAVGEGPGSVHHLVGLRDDAGLGDTVDDLAAAGDRLRDVDTAAVALEPGATLAGATPYAETPADVVTVEDVAGGGGTERGERTLRNVTVGADGTPARALLAAREVDADVRFCYAGTYDDATAAMLADRPDATEVDEATGEGSDAPAVEPIAGRVAAAFDGASETPVVGLPRASEPVVLAFAASVDDLLDGVTTLVDAVENRP